MKKLLLIAVLLFLPSMAMAQCNGVFPANTVCGTTTGGLPKPTSPGVFPGTAPGGSSGQIQYNNGGAFGGFTMSQDCTITTSGVITCSKTNNVAFGPFSTATDLNTQISHFNGGSGASSSTAWFGDGTWKSALTSSPIQFISSNTAIAVPGTFATIPAALASLDNAIFASGATATITVTGHQTYTSQINSLNPYGYNIVITGVASTTTAISSNTAATGAAGAWSTTFTVGSSSGISTGDVVGVESIAGPTNKELLLGAWVVSGIPDGTHVTVTITDRSPTAPPSGATGTMRIYPTQLTFTGVSGFEVGRIGGIQEMAIIGNGGPTGATFGVLAVGNDHMSQGHVVLGPHLAATSFQADNIRANYGGVIIAGSVISSNAGNNGFIARDLGHIDCMVGSGCIATGNGFGTFPNGSSGFLAENTSSMLHEGSTSAGNGGDGFYARTTSTVLCDNTNPCTSVANNRNNYRSQYNGYLQCASCFSGTSAGNGFIAEENSSMEVQASQSSNAAINGYFAQNSSFVDASGGSIVTGTTSGCGFNSTGPGSKMNAPAASVSGIVSGSAYCANLGGWTIMTGALGSTTANPTANTGAVPPAGFVNN